MPPAKKSKLTESKKQPTQPSLFKYIKNKKKTDIEFKINENINSHDNPFKRKRNENNDVFENTKTENEEINLSIKVEEELEEALNNLSIIAEFNNDHPNTSKEMSELINEIKYQESIIDTVSDLLLDNAAIIQSSEEIKDDTKKLSTKKVISPGELVELKPFKKVFEVDKNDRSRRVFCRTCSKSLVSRKQDLLDHIETKAHQDKASTVVNGSKAVHNYFKNGKSSQSRNFMGIFNSELLNARSLTVQ